MIMFKKIIQYFLSTRVDGSIDDRAERIFVSVILISGLADLLGIGLAINLMSPGLVYLLLGNGLFCWLLAYLYRKGGDKHLIGHICLAQHAISFCFQAWIQGGLISPASAAFFLLPAVAMLILGKRSASVWLVITTGILIAFYVYQSLNQPPKIGYDPSLREYLFFSGVLGTNITIFIILLSYEKNKSWTIKKLNERNTDLVEAQAEINAQKRLKDRLFAVVSHDLRGPIGTFAGLSKVSYSLLEKKQFSELNQIIDEMEKSASQVATLLDNLLNWASQELDEIPYNPEQIHVDQLIQQLMTIFEPMGRAKSIQLVSKVTDDLSIWADLNCTSTILRNLIQNAIKYTQEDGLISITTEKEGDYVGIKVSDTGVGIESNRLKELFEFSDNKVSYGTAGEKGVGLGLRLVHEFVKINRGNVKVDSIQGEGTSFIVFLPVSAMV